MKAFLWAVPLALASVLLLPGQEYELVLKGGHVIDPKNRIDGRRDIAIAKGRIAAVAESIDTKKALKIVDVSGFYVSPGFVDMHAHFWGTAGAGLHPDSHTLRSGVTTVVDAGGSGWRNFSAFQQAVMQPAAVRVLAWLNIVGRGMDGRAAEQAIADMDPKAAAQAIRVNRQSIVGIKTAHYDGPEWTAVDRAVEAGKLAGVPVMVDFGTFRPERPFEQLVTRKLRPGDIYTHLYLDSVPMLDEKDRVRPYLLEARKRGVLFDTGHGQGSFLFRLAVPAISQGFLPDTISTDLHTGSMNAGMKDMAATMSKFLSLGVPLAEVIARSTWAPARAIRREELGHLSPGAGADIAVFRIETGRFGYVDAYKARFDGTKRLVCELTLRDGKVAWELNGITRDSWDKLGKYKSQGDSRWDGTSEDGKNSRLRENAVRTK
ncbi:MAG TPA: amidohydrolase/deacetylase family metallohydrolase [Bryobacteraceae bacterium]|nr:amidohydrolase/deacetylase family metallohydrolase [Bryobacteraceae bacterium]